MSATTEVVTRAKVRDAIVPVPGHDPVRVALVTLDNGQDHRRPTTFGPAGLVAIERTLATLRERDDLDAIAITGKPFVFAVGADLTLLGGLRQHADVAAVGELGHRVFGHLASMPVPTFAFINGPAMGGGLEIALHCDHRTVSRSATGIALPEVSLGLVPGWGGSWLLPHLIGPDAAVTVIVENPLTQNKQLDAADAFELGIVDVALEPADFLTMSLRWAADIVRGRTEVTRPEVRRDAGAWSQAITRGRAVADARVHAAAPAAYRALDLIEQARECSRAEGFTAEDQALADLVLSPQAHASLYAFDLVQRRSRRPAGAPDPDAARTITKVGVVGTGLMGRQLALLCASRLRVPVTMLDQDEAAAEAGLAAVRGEVDMLTGIGVFGTDKANRLRASIDASADWERLADCDLVIEAVYEDLEVKREVLERLDAVLRPECVVATNTSALSVADMKERSAYPERVVGLHFFNPVAAMPLVEVVATDRTDDAALATAFAIVRSLGKTPVRCADRPGFVVNRVLGAFVDATLSAVQEGTPPQDVEDAALGLGLPMGPLQLIELVGPSVALRVGETLVDAFPERFHQPDALATLVELDLPALTERTDHGVVVVPEVVAALTFPGEVLDADAVRDRALRAVADEITAMLDEGVVDDVRDIDLCLLLGAGWPFHLGGITPELRRRALL